VRLQALVEVVSADARNNDGHQQQDDSEDGEGSQRLPGRLVVFLSRAVCNVHADELEEEVRQRNEVDNDTGDHAGNRLAADPESSREEQEECYDQSGGGEDNFDCGGLLDDDEELNGEGKEEEEVEFEKRDIDLEVLASIFRIVKRGCVPGMSDSASSVADQR
jgi:hypothetical protein